MIYALAALVIGLVLLNTIAIAIVYRRNHGQLSVYKSYRRARLHLFRFLGWYMIVCGSIFSIVSVAALLGAPFRGNWPWWSILLCMGFVGMGYGVQRFARFVLNDPDWNNMFASKDR